MAILTVTVLALICDLMYKPSVTIKNFILYCKESTRCDLCYQEKSINFDIVSVAIPVKQATAILVVLVIPIVVISLLFQFLCYHDNGYILQFYYLGVV